MFRTIALLPHFSISIAIGRPFSRPFGLGRKSIARSKPVERSLPAPVESELESEEPLAKPQATWRVVDGKVRFAWTIVPQPGSEVSPE